MQFIQMSIYICLCVHLISLWEPHANKLDYLGPFATHHLRLFAPIWAIGAIWVIRAILAILAKLLTQMASQYNSFII